MKILTVNFLTCAVKACKTSPLSYPLHFRDAELEQQDLDFNPTFIQNILPRVDWEGLKVTANEVCPRPLPLSLPFLAAFSLAPTAPLLRKCLMLRGSKQLGFTTLPDTKPEGKGEGEFTDVQTGDEREKLLRDLHTLLLETQVTEGKLVCGNCGHEYAIKEGIANFLLPSHLV